MARINNQARIECRNQEVESDSIRVTGAGRVDAMVISCRGGRLVATLTRNPHAYDRRSAAPIRSRGSTLKLRGLSPR
jgi:hypothetical protein